MNMLEALRQISEPDVWLWARPTAWRGAHTALSWNPALKDWHIVPDPRGGRAAYLPGPNLLFGEWEVVEPREVNEGR